MLTIYNTAGHKKEELKPIHENEVRFYGCGPTVYNYAHIGNMRAFFFMIYSTVICGIEAIT